MLSRETLERTAHYFALIADKENEVDLQRQVLANLENFEPYMAFRRIDRCNHGYLLSIDLVHFLKENGVLATESDCFFILNYYDHNKDSKLTYTE